MKEDNERNVGNQTTGYLMFNVAISIRSMKSFFCLSALAAFSLLLVIHHRTVRVDHLNLEPGASSCFFYFAYFYMLSDFDIAPRHEPSKVAVALISELGTDGRIACGCICEHNQCTRWFGCSLHLSVPD